MGRIYNWFFGEPNNDIKNEVVEKEIDMTQDTSINIFDDDNEVNSSSISEKEAMQIPALASGVDLIANSIAILPVKLYKINENNGEKEEVVGDKRVDLLNIANNPFDSAYNMKYAQVKNLILNGTTYTFIAKDNRNNIQALYYLHKKDVNPELVRTGKGLYDYTFSFQLFEDYMKVNSDAMLLAFKDCERSSDIEGVGILKKGGKILQLALDEMNNGSNALNNRIPGYLSTDASLSPQAKSNIRKSFKGMQKSGNVPILEEGLKYNAVNNLKPQELELLESRKYTTEAIAQLLNIPFTYMLSSATSYNNSSEESIRFLKITLMPYIRILEEAYNKFLLTDRELLQQQYRFEFDTTQILKISSQEQADYLKSLKQSGLITPNECRKQLGMKHIEGADFLEVAVNTYQLINGEISLPSMEQEQQDNNDNNQKQDKLEE